MPVWTFHAFTVLQTSPRFVNCILAATFAFALLASAQKPNAPPVLPSAEQTALKRGQEALAQGDVKRARSEFERAVSLAPNDAAAQGALGWILSLQGETEPAIT